MKELQEDRIVRKITKAFDEKFDTKFDALSARVDKIDATQNRLVEKVVDMDARLDTFATKDELRAVEARITDTLDTHTVILKRLDDERSVTNFRLDRLESHAGLS